MFNIPNPTKKITLDFSLETVKTAILRTPIISYPKYKLHSSNDIINLITLECFEFLSLGVYIDFLLTSVDNKTEVNIEIRRKLGSFDNSVEIQKASEHMVNLMNLISQCISLTDDEFNKTHQATISQIQLDLTNSQIPWYAKKNVANIYLITGIILLPIFVGVFILPLGIYAKVKQIKYNKK